MTSVPNNSIADKLRVADKHPISISRFVWGGIISQLKFERESISQAKLKV